ncbi:MAG: hypothetical protein IT376_23095 [Polyangiaceae bacterium]|nr:hypothetical protein [Polyangiaceae bacterium]
MKLRHLAVLTSVLVLHVACGADDESTASGGGGAAGASGGAGAGGGNPAVTIGAAGVTVTRVDLYQGLRQTLMRDGAPQPLTLPLVQGRAAMMRVFFRTEASYDGQPVVARLSVEGAPAQELAFALPQNAESNEAQYETTLNYQIPGDQVGAALPWRVEILQDHGAENPAARYPAQGFEATPIEGKPNKFRVMMVPFRYDTDGSGRVPDVGPEQIARYKNRFFSLYPVSDVEVTVHEPVPTTVTLSANGNGWQSVGFALANLRSSEGIPDDVYLYGFFNPAPSLFSFCGAGGCLLGVTLLNNNPPDVGSVSLRLALGVGFTDQLPGSTGALKLGIDTNTAADTAAHELGHAHGRRHSPCAPGNQIQDVDPAYPHPGAQIGEWGFDLVAQYLYAPDQWTDIMGYCNKQFVSDFTYRALYERMQRVNMPAATGRFEYQIVGVDGAGQAEIGPRVSFGEPALGAPVEVQTVGEDGEVSTLVGQRLDWDHLPGSWVLVPVTRGELVRAELVLAGQRVVAIR